MVQTSCFGDGPLVHAFEGMHAEVVAGMFASQCLCDVSGEVLDSGIGIDQVAAFDWQAQQKASLGAFVAEQILAIFFLAEI